MTGGRLTINFADSEVSTQSIDLGTITSWSNTVQKRGLMTPIVTQGVQNTFPIENGNSQSYSFAFTHYNGQNGETNAEWFEKVTSAIDRWQARTDGCTLIYEPGLDNPYAVRMEIEGYIKSITRNYKNDFNEVISGTMEFTAGFMHINDRNRPPGTESMSGMYIMMSDPQQVNWYALYGGNDDVYHCVDSVEIKAGPESPFEYAVITIPRKKLMEQIPDLYGNIIDGMNRIYLNIFGHHDMFVQKVSSSESSITITAYCTAQVYRQIVLGSAITNTPMGIIRTILSDASLGVSFAEDSIVYRYIPSETSEMALTMPRGTMAYRALQICARILGCRLFFADNKTYLIDYRLSPIDSNVPNLRKSGDNIIFNAGDLDIRFGDDMKPCTVGTSSTDETGFDPVKNHVTVEYSLTDESGNITSASERITDELSVSVLNTMLDKGTVKLPELSAEHARAFGRNMLSYLREPQRSMTFTLKEVYGQSGTWGKRWKSYFTPCAVADSLTDSYNSERIDNTSILVDNSKAYQKLILSEYTRQFPKGTCEYTFGMIASVELSDNLSQTSMALNS